MKKLIVLMLVLGLAVPVNAWHLFPVREKIVKEKETDYAVTVVVGAVTLGLSVLSCFFIGRKLQTNAVKEAKDSEDIGRKLRIKTATLNCKRRLLGV
jgi:hypothetical protein